jgi:ribonuclease HI
VHKGHKPGVYTSWADAQNTITDFKGAVYKSFKTRDEAQSFFKNGHPPKRASEEPSQLSPPAKKQKKDTDDSEDLVEYNAGEGPLPAGAEDGFDPRITLNPLTGKVEYKEPTTKWQAVNLQDGKPVIIYTDGSSLGNGAHGAVAGVGVYFGPKDKRYGHHVQSRCRPALTQYTAICLSLYRVLVKRTNAPNSPPYNVPSRLLHVIVPSPSTLTATIR